MGWCNGFGPNFFPHCYPLVLAVALGALTTTLGLFFFDFIKDIDLDPAASEHAVEVFEPGGQDDAVGGEVFAVGAAQAHVAQIVVGGAAPQRQGRGRRRRRRRRRRQRHVIVDQSDAGQPFGQLVDAQTPAAVAHQRHQTAIFARFPFSTTKQNSPSSWRAIFNRNPKCRFTFCVQINRPRERDP